MDFWTVFLGYLQSICKNWTILCFKYVYKLGQFMLQKSHYSEFCFTLFKVWWSFTQCKITLCEANLYIQHTYTHFFALCLQFFDFDWCVLEGWVDGLENWILDLWKRKEGDWILSKKDNIFHIQVFGDKPFGFWNSVFGFSSAQNRLTGFLVSLFAVHFWACAPCPAHTNGP